jgi:hypothetical protein
MNQGEETMVYLQNVSPPFPFLHGRTAMWPRPANHNAKKEKHSQKLKNCSSASDRELFNRGECEN